MIKIEIPWIPEISKNKKFKYKTRKILSDGYKDGKELITWKIIQTGKHTSFIPKTKTFVFIKCYRPNFKGDIQNFEEAICDAIKVGINVGDNYFCPVFNYELDRDNPRIIIIIEQENGPAATLFESTFQKIFRFSPKVS